MFPPSQQRAASPPAGGHGDSDPVTRLPSRRQFLDLLGEEIEGLGAGNGSLAVLLVDLDGFRRINRDLGHGVGDQLLFSAGRRLLAAVRGDDVVARAGGDEFVVLSRGLAAGSDVVDLAAAILCILGALVTIVGAFLPQAKLDFSGTPVDLADNTMVAAGYGIAVIAAAVIGAAIAAWAYVKAARTWLPILLGAVIVVIAVYAGTAGLDVTPDFAPSGLSLDDAGDPSTGIFAVAAGGLLMVLGGIGLARESR